MALHYFILLPFRLRKDKLSYLGLPDFKISIGVQKYLPRLKKLFTIFETSLFYRLFSETQQEHEALLFKKKNKYFQAIRMNELKIRRQIKLVMFIFQNFNNIFYVQHLIKFRVKIYSFLPAGHFIILEF